MVRFALYSHFVIAQNTSPEKRENALFVVQGIQYCSEPSFINGLVVIISAGWFSPSRKHIINMEVHKKYLVLKPNPEDIKTMKTDCSADLFTKFYFGTMNRFSFYGLSKRKKTFDFLFDPKKQGTLFGSRMSHIKITKETINFIKYLREIKKKNGYNFKIQVGKRVKKYLAEHYNYRDDE